MCRDAESEVRRIAGGAETIAVAGKAQKAMSADCCCTAWEAMGRDSRFGCHDYGGAGTGLCVGASVSGAAAAAVCCW